MAAHKTDQVRARGWPVDAHVHLHRLADVPATLDAAAANFQRAVPGGPALLGGLLLTQMSREVVFEALCKRENIGDWRLERIASEPQTLLAGKGAISLAVICGRQVRADDGLEVAALGTLQAFRDGLPFAECLSAVIRAGAVAVIPWGFGKWTGSRARRVERVLANRGEVPVFLGDSGSRTGVMGEPAIIRRNRGQGVRVLAGTDPFPFGGDYRRVGSFGFLAGIDAQAAPEPWQALRSWLVASRDSPPIFGKPGGVCRFVLNQLGVQVHNRLHGRDAS